MLFDAGIEYKEGHNAKSYGLCYMGSKNLIVKKLTAFFPCAENFYDLFAGGGSVTHYLLTQNKYNHFYMNDLDPLPIDLFKRAVNDGFRDEKRWISREDFFRLKDKDGYVRYCWSFGNRGDTYMYGAEVEPYKRAFHHAVVFDDFSEVDRLCPELADATREAVSDVVDLNARRLRFGKAVVSMAAGRIKGACDLRFYYLERLQNLEVMERLLSLGKNQRFADIEFSVQSYDEVPIKKNSVVYCDIPYENTAKYNISGNFFGYNRFYEWCGRQSEPVFISSYELPADKFHLVAEFNKHVTLSAVNIGFAMERLYVPVHQKELIIESKLF